MSTLNVAALQDVDAAGSKATLPITGSNFTLGPGWGAWEFVSSASITVVTNLDSQLMAAGYDYQVSVRGAAPVSDGVDLQAQVFQSTSIVTGSVYADAAAVNSTSIRIMNAVGFVATEGCSTDILFLDPNSTGFNKPVMPTGRLEFTNAGISGITSSTGGAYVGNTNACDGLRLFWSSGNWQAQGKIVVFRRRLS